MADEVLSADSQRILDEVLKRYGLSPQLSTTTTRNVLHGAGAAAAGAADSMAANRSARVQAAYDEERLNEARQASFFERLLAREADRRDSGRDAYLNSVRAAYMRNPGIPKDAPFKPVRSAEQLKAADLLQGEAMKRLEAGDSLLPAVADPGRFQYDPELLRESATEKALGWGGLAATAAGQVPGSAWGKVGKGALKVGAKLLDFIF